MHVPSPLLLDRWQQWVSLVGRASLVRLFTFNAPFDFPAHNDGLLGFQHDIHLLWFPILSICSSESFIPLVSLFVCFRTSDHHYDSCLQTSQFLREFPLGFFQFTCFYPRSSMYRRDSCSQHSLFECSSPLNYLFLVFDSIYALTPTFLLLLH